MATPTASSSKWRAKCCRSSPARRCSPASAAPIRSGRWMSSWTRSCGLAFSGVQNFPTVGLIDGRFRAGLEETGMGYGCEVEMIAKAHARDLLTTPTSSIRRRPRRWRAPAPTSWSATSVLPSAARSARRPRRRFEDCPALTDAMAEAALAVNPRRADPGSRRPDRRAGRCRIRAGARPALPRFLRRLVDGAPAGRARAVARRLQNSKPSRKSRGTEERPASDQKVGGRGGE